MYNNNSQHNPAPSPHQVFNEKLKPHMSEGAILSLMALSSEFESMAVREEEMPELDGLARAACPHDVKVTSVCLSVYSVSPSVSLSVCLTAR